MVTNLANSSHSAALRATLTWTPQSLRVLRRILSDQPDTLTRKDPQGNTILHFLAAGGNATAFRELFEGGLLTTRSNGGSGGELIRTRNWREDTVLHEAARFGKVNVVEIIMDKERELVLKTNALGETPLYLAAANGEEKVFNLLKVETAHVEGVLRRDDGCTILHAAILGEHYGDLAMEIVESFPNLSGAQNIYETTPLNILASKPVSFKSGSSYCLRNLGSRPFIPLQFLLCLFYLLVPWLNGVHNVKKKHACVLNLAKRLIAKEEDWSHYTNSSGRNPLLQAAENSIQELVKEILGKFPEAAYCNDCKGKNIFHIAVEKKDEIMYQFLKNNVARKEGMMAALDHDQNSILHLATKHGPNPRVPLGSLNQMAWDVYWFTLVCYDSPPHLLRYPNSGGKMPAKLFEDTHSGLRKDAEDALKSMNNSLMLVSALIGTVNYAAVFTMPGGFDSNRDSRGFSRPLLYGTHKEVDLLLFLWFTGVALFAAFIALVEMISIQLSKFTSSDFFLALPIKYIIAATALYVSVVFTIVACFEAYDIINLKVNIYFFLGPALAIATIISIDAMYLTLCNLCRAFVCLTYHRGRMFEAVIFKHSIEEASCT